MKKLVFALTLAAALVAVAPAQDVFERLHEKDIPAIKALIEKDPEAVNARDGNGRTPLHYAAAGGEAEFIGYLLDKGAELEAADASRRTPLHWAAMNDRAEAVALLLKRGAALESRDDYGRTALIICARERGQAATGRLLLEAGADVNALDRFESSALELAAWRAKSDFIDLLLEKGARVPEEGRKWGEGVFLAASEGLTTLFRRLTVRGQDLKIIDPSGESFLHAAAAGGSAEIVGVLLGQGYDAARPDRLGWTPLHYAARDGRVDVIRLLAERGAPLDARTLMGQTALNIARERKYEAAAALLAEKGADPSEIRFPVLEGDYLGQKPPGEKPELFAPGIISSVWGLHSTAVFSPDGNEVYWAPMITRPGVIYGEGGLYMMRRVDGRWTPPKWASFSGADSDDDVPFFSADGRRIYFISRRPLPGETENGSEKIWYADRTPGGAWGEPRPLDRAVNEQDKHWQFSIAGDGTLVFAGTDPNGLGMNDIHVARLAGGRYEKPVNVGKPVNSEAGEECPFIAPDGSYLLFSRQYDLWASFRGEDGAWSEPVNLGPEINSPSIELCPVVTADGKYLFFLSQRDGESHAYWTGAGVIEKARRKAETDRAARGELEAVERSIRASIGWAKDKDFKLLYDTIANDAGFLEVHPEGKVVKGFEEFKKGEAFWGSPDFQAVRYEIRDLKITLSKSGDAAWFFCILDDINTWKGKPANWENTRWTGVLEKRDGRWVMVQQHFSFAEEGEAPPPAGADRPVVFYSGRSGNKDVYILHPGEKEPRNLTNHPAQDLCPAPSPDGRRIVFLSDRDGNMDIFSAAVDGSDVRRLTASPETEEHPEFTPDGGRILFVRDFESRTEIWVMNADGSEARRLTRNEARDERPFLSPDGSKILFMSNRDGRYQIYTMNPDGSDQVRLARTADWDIFPAWSPDGKRIAYSRKFRDEGRMKGMIRVMNADGSGDRAVTGIETRDENAMWSPDGRYILFQSVRDGNFEVYQVEADGSRPVRLTDHPDWDGWASYVPVKK